MANLLGFSEYFHPTLGRLQKLGQPSQGVAKRHERDMCTHLATRVPPCPIPNVGSSAFVCPAGRRGARCLPPARMEMRGSDTQPGVKRFFGFSGSAFRPMFRVESLAGFNHPADDVEEPTRDAS